MSDFKAKMHQIQLWLGLNPRPHWKSLQRSPDSLAGFKGPTSKGGERKGGGGEDRRGRSEGRNWEGRKGKEQEGRKEEKGRNPKGCFTPHVRSPENTLTQTLLRVTY